MMRRTFVLLAGAGFAAAVPFCASAQEQQTPLTTPPVAAAPPAASEPPFGNVGTPPGNVGARPGGQPSSLRERIQATRQQCQQEAIAQGARGPAASQQIESCFATKMPDIAKRIDCRREGLSKGIDQAGMRAYVLQRLASKGSSGLPQAQPGSPTPSATPPSQSASRQSAPVGPPTSSQQQRFDEVRRACTDAADAQGLKDYQFDRSVRTCFQRNPYVIERERECRQEGAARGLIARDLRSFMRRCMTD
jgi:hypothetical protein